MRIATKDESQHWCADNGFDVDFSKVDIRSWNAVRFLTRHKHRAVAAFVRGMVAYRPFDGAIVYISDWPLYNDDEMAVAMRFRASISDARPLINAAGHIFNKHELHDCIGLFNLCLTYLWDAILYVPASNLLFFNSHDEIQYVTLLSGLNLHQLKGDMEPFNLTILDES